ncbi:2-hydroxyacyl-CoA dehydratase subunit D [Chloroflexota bacterium]
MPIKRRYETRPLESWAKAKELRQQHYRDVWEAREKGKILASGGESSFFPLLAGLGEFEFFGGEPFGASSSATDPDFVIRCHEAIEAKGYTGNMCAYQRVYWGAMLLNESSPETMPFFGEFVKPDFSLPWAMCDNHGKWYQTVAEYHKTPVYVIGVPLRPHSDDDAGRRESHVNGLVAEFEDAIEWMMKVTRKEHYDDEALIEAVTNAINNTAIWAKCCEENKAIPAPLDMKSMYSLYVINSLMRHKKEVTEFYKMLYDEVKERVADGIAAIGNERYRVLHDPEPIWHYLKLFRYLEEYGVVCNSSIYGFTIGTSFVRGENGSWAAAKTMGESGKALRTRSDALRLLAESYIDNPGIMAWYPGNKTEDTVRMARDWKCDGAVLSLNCGCSLTAGQLESKLALEKAGFPAMLYDANMTDPRKFDEAALLRNIDEFMEGQGLQKIEE